jgi:redox-regulated HSP33 family molecular chaperone
VITLDPRDGNNMYQGIVAIEKGSIAELLEHHMRNSEQLATRLWLVADGERARGLLLQKLPTPSDGAERSDDDWERVTLLGSTVRQPSCSRSMRNRCFAAVRRRGGPPVQPHPVASSAAAPKRASPSAAAARPP